MFGKANSIKAEFRTIWGLKELIYFENLHNNTVYITIINDSIGHSLIKLPYEKNRKLGTYILQFMPNYISKENYNKLYLEPEEIKPINGFNFSDLSEDTLKILHFENIIRANDFIKVFGNSYLKTGVINCVVNDKLLIEFWNNNKGLENPHLWGTIANYVIKNYYSVCKYLDPKKIDIKEHKPYVTTGFENQEYKNRKYYYYGKVNDTTTLYYKTTPLTDVEIKQQLLDFPLLYKQNYKDDMWGEDYAFILNKYIQNGLTIAGLASNSYAFKIGKFKITIDEPMVLCSQFVFINDILYIEPTLKIIGINPIHRKLPKDLSFDNKLFLNKSLINDRLYNLNINSSKIGDITNIIDFIYNAKANITLENYEKELYIARYLKCEKYINYIKNWLIINDLKGYYNCK